MTNEEKESKGIFIEESQWKELVKLLCDLDYDLNAYEQAKPDIKKVTGEDLPKFAYLQGRADHHYYEVVKRAIEIKNIVIRIGKMDV